MRNISRRGKHKQHLEQVRHKHWHSDHYWERYLKEALATDNDWLLGYSEELYKWEERAVRREAAGKSFRHYEVGYDDMRAKQIEKESKCDFRNQIRELSEPEPYVDEIFCCACNEREIYEEYDPDEDDLYDQDGFDRRLVEVYDPDEFMPQGEVFFDSEIREWCVKPEEPPDKDEEPDLYY